MGAGGSHLLNRNANAPAALRWGRARREIFCAGPVYFVRKALASTAADV